MTRFKPGDLAQVVHKSRTLLADLQPGDVVEVVADIYGDGDIFKVTRAFGEPDRDDRGDGHWSVSASALRLVPADEQGDDRPSPAASPLAALIEAGTTFLRAVLANRVSIEQEWQATNRTTYRIVVTPEEK